MDGMLFCGLGRVFELGDRLAMLSTALGGRSGLPPVALDWLPEFAPSGPISALGTAALLPVNQAGGAV